MSEESEKSGGLGRWVLLALVAGVLAVTLSEGLRDRILDAMFGAEEEFDYSPAEGSANGSGAGAMNGTAPAAAEAKAS